LVRRRAVLRLGRYFTVQSRLVHGEDHQHRESPVTRQLLDWRRCIFLCIVRGSMVLVKRLFG
jgi:hypothetical protein